MKLLSLLSLGLGSVFLRDCAGRVTLTEPTKPNKTLMSPFVSVLARSTMYPNMPTPLTDKTDETIGQVAATTKQKGASHADIH